MSMYNKHPRRSASLYVIDPRIACWLMGIPYLVLGVNVWAKAAGCAIIYTNTFEADVNLIDHEFIAFRVAFTNPRLSTTSSSASLFTKAGIERRLCSSEPN